MRIRNPISFTFLLPFVLSFSVVMLGFFLVKEGYARITSLGDQYEDLEKKKVVLENKLEELRKIDPNVIDKGDTTILALPDTSGGAFIISNVRAIAQGRNIEVSKISMESKGQAKEKNYAVDEIQLTLTANSMEDLIEVLKGIYNTIPITTLFSVKVSVGLEKVEANLGISGYFSSLPTQLPALTEPINKLNQQDVSILNKIVNFQKPSLMIITPEVNEARTNPFL